MFDRLALIAAILLSALPAQAAERLPDPTAPEPLTAPADTATGWSLQSTRVTAERRLAIVNGVRVGVGDRIGGAEVVAIGHGTVRLRLDGRVLDLSLLGGDTRPPSPLE